MPLDQYLRLLFGCDSNVMIPYVNLLFLMPLNFIRAWSYNYTPPYASLVRRWVSTVSSVAALLRCLNAVRTLRSVVRLLDTSVMFGCFLLMTWPSLLRALRYSSSQKQIGAWTGQSNVKETKTAGFSLLTEPSSYGWSRAFHMGVESKPIEQGRCCLLTQITYKLKLIVVPSIIRSATD